MSLPPKRSRPAARDLERYAGLFASRTKVMKSSAMRDLMAITERPEVISLAGGLPDTSTFPPESLREDLRARRRRGATAKALQYGPTEGQDLVKECIVEVMAGRGHDRRPRRHHRHHRRPAGHRPRLQDAPRPGRRHRRRGADVPGRGAGVLRLRGRRRADRDGQRRHADRRARGDARPAGARGAAAEVHLHDPELPEPGRRDDVAAAPQAPGRGRRRARAARPGGQPVRAAALRGRAAADAAARSTAASSSSTSGRSRRSSRPACASGGRSRRGRCWRR